MSYRKFEMYQYRQILHLMRQGQSDRLIAKTNLAGRPKCRVIRTIAVQQGWLNPEHPLPDDKQLSDRLSDPQRSNHSVSSVEPYRETVLQWTQQNIRGTVIHQALVSRFGFTGSYDAVRRFLKRNVEHPVKATAPLDFDPAEATQVDFGKGPDIVDTETGEIIKTWIFVMTLCFSRHMYVEIVRDQRVETWLGCHRRAFEFFGGVVTKIIIDNAKCAITKACFHDPEVQRAYAECAEGYGFIISPCPPREPQMKGRVESGVKYVKKSFVPLRQFRSIADANAQVKQWVLGQAGNRCHGSTHQKPLTVFTEVEKHLLKKLPDQPPELATWVKVKVHGDCHVQYLKCRYSVPYRLVRQTLWLRASETSIRLYQDHELVAMHSRAFKPGHRMTLQKHLPTNAQAYLMKDATWCRTQAKQIGPSCEQLIERWFADKVLDRLRAAQGIIGLAKSYGKARLDAACHRAMAFNSCRYKTVKHILKQGLEYETLPDEISFELTGKAYTEGVYLRHIDSDQKH